MIQKLFAKIIDNETKKVIVGTGTNSKFYESLGMELMEVKKGVDGDWYKADSKIQDYDLIQKISDYQRFLTSTDWYVSRFAETGKAIPEDIKLKRAEAREIISNLKKQLEEGNK